jgi:hypothetical protein
MGVNIHTPEFKQGLFIPQPVLGGGGGGSGATLNK